MIYHLTEEQFAHASKLLDSVRAAADYRKSFYTDLRTALEPNYSGKGDASPDYELIILLAPIVAELSKSLFLQRQQIKAQLDAMHSLQTTEERTWTVMFEP